MLDGGQWRLENLKIIKGKVKVNLHSLMDDIILDNGKQVNNMALVSMAFAMEIKGLQSGIMMFLFKVREVQI